MDDESCSWESPCGSLSGDVACSMIFLSRSSRKMNFVLRRLMTSCSVGFILGGLPIEEMLNDLKIK